MTEKQPADAGRGEPLANDPPSKDAPFKEACSKQAWAEPKATALLVLADGTVIEGVGFGATGHAVGEVCFNTAMTGYEEILTDPSYAGQIITFTFPHIGNVGTNEDDIETVNMAATPGARGVVLHTAITQPSNYRATRHLDQWLKARGIIGISGIDTRALTSRIRVNGMPNAVIAHEPSGRFDLEALAPQHERDDVEDARIVVDDENRAHATASSRTSACSSTMRTRVPSPSAESSSM